MCCSKYARPSFFAPSWARDPETRRNRITTLMRNGLARRGLMAMIVPEHSADRQFGATWQIGLDFLDSVPGVGNHPPGKANKNGRGCSAAWAALAGVPISVRFL